MVVAAYTPRNVNLLVLTRKAPKAVIVSPGIGGKMFSIYALMARSMYMMESGREERK